ncbi:MAG: anthrone oxygenase family protein [Poseidonia sp.]
MYLLIFGSILYLFGVQLPTFRFNIPLNNTLQNLDIESLEESEATLSRVDFEIPWNRWNKIRTVNAILAVSMLLLLLIRY